MTVVVGLLIGNDTWKLQEKSIRSLRAAHPDQDIILYYSLDEFGEYIVQTLNDLSVESVDIGRPGLMGSLSPSTYSNYNTLDFNIKTSFKWLALLGAMSTRLDNVIFLDADITIVTPLPFSVFNEIWEYYDVFAQDEGNSILPKHPCTGFMGFKFCEANIALLEKLHKEQCCAIVSGESQHDQTTFYNLIARDIEVYRKIYFLPQMLFPVGYMGPIYSRFNQSNIKLVGQSEPILYHANWVVGIEAKGKLMDAMHESSPTANTNENTTFKNYLIGRFTIDLPIDHMLPSYQLAHPKYDRFLPCLARFLPTDSVVIDVGANVGDTLAGMASCNPNLDYFCIEADEDFYSLLTSNIELIKELEPDLKAFTSCNLIGREIDNAILEGCGGTKRAVESSNISSSIRSIEFDDFISSSMPKDKIISLLKIDTDGWDYDVINSALETVKQYLPLIFFECQYSEDYQLHKYIETIDTLASLGYDSWFIFDNFGELILETNNKETITQLANYINNQTNGKSTRTIYYMDVLAATDGNREIAVAALNNHASS
jgi:FkbM family methyltransferase